MEIRILITFLIIVLISHSIYRLYSDYSAMGRKLKSVEEQNGVLKKDVSDLAGRVGVLEQTRSTRIPYQVAEDIINARAALDRQKDDFRISLELIENAEAWLDRAMKIGTKEDK